MRKIKLPVVEKMKYFSYNAEAGFALWATAQEAEKAAQAHIDNELKHCDEGFSEDAHITYWGELKGAASMFKTGKTLIFDGEQTDEYSIKLEAV